MSISLLIRFNHLHRPCAALLPLLKVHNVPASLRATWWTEYHTTDPAKNNSPAFWGGKGGDDTALLWSHRQLCWLAGGRVEQVIETAGRSVSATLPGTKKRCCERVRPPLEGFCLRAVILVWPKDLMRVPLEWEAAAPLPPSLKTKGNILSSSSTVSCFFSSVLLWDPSNQSFSFLPKAGSVAWQQ